MFELKYNSGSIATNSGFPQSHHVGIKILTELTDSEKFTIPQSHDDGIEL
jgi:hypothetical protein